MEWINWLIIGLLGIFIVKRMLPVSGVENITTADLAEKMKTTKSGTNFIDVRTKGEFKSRAIRGFKNIPLQVIAEGTTELNKDDEIVVICQSGMRSKQAATKLKKLGFKNVINVSGGMSAWSGPTK